MCTAVTYKKSKFYFGRTLDHDFSYGEHAVVVPRKFPFNFRFVEEIKNHYAICGIAHMCDNYPLFYDAFNEKGLCVAGLNFTGNAVYSKVKKEGVNLAQFEFIPYILCNFSTVEEVIRGLKNINITDEPFNKDYPAAELHWLIADKNKAITVEFVKDGLKIYLNPAGVLTNNPPFDMQMQNLTDYKHLSACDPENTFAPALDLKNYTKGMGAIGLPGDLSSKSRFVRAAFTKCNCDSDDDEISCVNAFFHILGTVSQTRGCSKSGGGDEVTLYTSCASAERGVYYFTTYKNHRISAVNMFAEDLENESLSVFDIYFDEDINKLN